MNEVFLSQAAAIRNRQFPKRNLFFLVYLFSIFKRKYASVWWAYPNISEHVKSPKDPKLCYLNKRTDTYITQGVVSSPVVNLRFAFYLVHYNDSEVKQSGIFGKKDNPFYQMSPVMI